MNLMKLMMVGLLLSSFLFLVTGCSDNDDSGVKFYYGLWQRWRSYKTKPILVGRV